MVIYHENGLPGHPPDGQEAAGLALEVVRPVAGATHAEVGDFDASSGPHEAISRAKMSTSETVLAEK